MCESAISYLTTKSVRIMRGSVDERGSVVPQTRRAQPTNSMQSRIMRKLTAKHAQLAPVAHEQTKKPFVFAGCSSAPVHGKHWPQFRACQTPSHSLQVVHAGTRDTGQRGRRCNTKYSPFSTLVAGARKIRLESLSAGNPIGSPVGLQIAHAGTADVVVVRLVPESPAATVAQGGRGRLPNYFSIASTVSNSAVGPSGQAAGSARTLPSMTVCPSS